MLRKGIKDKHSPQGTRLDGLCSRSLQSPGGAKGERMRKGQLDVRPEATWEL